MKRTLTIGKKLTFVVGAMALVVLALSYFSLRAVNALEATYNKTVDKTVRRTALADAMNIAESDMMVGQRGMLLYTLLKNPPQAEEPRRLFHAKAEAMAKAIAEFRPLIATEDGRQLISKIDSDVTAWKEVFAEMEQRCGRGDAAGAAAIGLSQGIPLYREIGQSADRLNEIQATMMKNDKANAAGLSTQSRWVVSVLIGLALVAGALNLFVVRRRVGCSRRLQPSWERAPRRLLPPPTRSPPPASRSRKAPPNRPPRLKRLPLPARRLAP